MASNLVSPGNTIELRVREIAQLFHTLDPFPFRERDLDAEVEDYIVGWAGELRSKEPIRIVVHIPSAEATTKRANEIEAALQHYFEYRAQVLEREFKELMRVGRLSMLVGLGVFIICLTASHLAARYLGGTSFGNWVEQSFLILGWVANWRPLEIFLYDWWPIVRRRRLYRRLAAARVDLKTYEASSA